LTIINTLAKTRKEKPDGIFTKPQCLAILQQDAYTTGQRQAREIQQQNQGHWQIGLPRGRQATIGVSKGGAINNQSDKNNTAELPTTVNELPATPGSTVCTPPVTNQSG